VVRTPKAKKAAAASHGSQRRRERATRPQASAAISTGWMNIASL